MQLKLTDISNVLILGCGTLGLRVGLQSAISGMNTVMYDIDEAAFAGAKKTQASILKNLIERNIITGAVAEAAQNRISFTTDPALAGANADFVNESVVEDLEIKKKVWAQFATLYHQHILFDALPACSRNRKTEKVLCIPFSRCILGKRGRHYATPWYRTMGNGCINGAGAEIKSNTRVGTKRITGVHFQFHAGGTDWRCRCIGNF
jgi:3-hydroxyacyl-CoA dehydrogenase, NAD binding domain